MRGSGCCWWCAAGALRDDARITRAAPGREVARSSPCCFARPRPVLCRESRSIEEGEKNEQLFKNRAVFFSVCFYQLAPMLSVLARRCRLPIRRQARCIETHREPPLPRCRKEERASTPKRLNRRGVQSSTAVVVAASTSSSPSSSSSSLSPWLCPACSSPLSPSEDGKSLSCPQNHCYDLARERYVNLLRSGRKAKKTGAAPPGDAPDDI